MGILLEGSLLWMMGRGGGRGGMRTYGIVVGDIWVVCYSLGTILGGLFTCWRDVMWYVVQEGRNVVRSFCKKVCICDGLVVWETFKILVSRGSIFW